MKSLKENTNIKYGIILSYASIVISLLANIFLQRFINMEGNELLSSQYNLYSFSSSISSLLTILTLGLTSGYIRFATRAEKEKGSSGLKETNSVYCILLVSSAILAFAIGTILSILFIIEHSRKNFNHFFHDAAGTYFRRRRIYSTVCKGGACKRLVRINSNNNWKHLAGTILSPGVKLLAKIHDVHALRT